MEEIEMKKISRKEIIILLIILLIGALMRFYRIGEYMTFLGDEGRDAIIVRRLLVNFDLILIGPGTSIGNMYLGPLYYYLIAPSLLLANFSPVGPSAFVALIGVLTIGLVWWVGREWFGPVAASVAALLYAISPTVIIYSRSSWNPNVMPFFALLTIWAIWRVWNNREFWWLVVAGVAMAMVLQSHYLGLLLIPVIGLYWGLTFLETRWGGNIKRLMVYSLVSMLIFLFLMSPLLIFDIRHGWINAQAIKTFFTVRQTTISARPWRALPNVWPLMQKISTRLMAGRNEILGMWVALGITSGLIWIKRKKREYGLILVWLGFALLGLGVYKQEIYDHYFGFFFAAPFLLLGGMMQEVIDKSKIRGWWIVGTVMFILIYFNLINSPLRQPPVRQLQRTVAVAEKIKDEAGEKKFNLAVIAERNYEDAYQYYLEKWKTNVIDIDPLNYEETVGDELYVVCEMPAEKCDPTHNPKAEVANFGWSVIDDQWNVNGVLIYKLIHSNEEGDKAQ